jgi:hypothetical protein
MGNPQVQRYMAVSRSCTMLVLPGVVDLSEAGGDKTSNGEAYGRR